MRLLRGINIVIPNERRQLIIEILNNLGVDHYVVSDDNNTFITFSIPVSKAETVIEALEKVGLGILYGLLQVYNIEYSPEIEKMEKEERAPRASREEILLDIIQMSKLNVNYVTYTILAAILAAVSLLANNIIILVASMIIAPIMGPILGISMGTVLGREDLQKQGLKSELIGIGLCIMVGCIISLIIPFMVMTDSIYVRSHPTIIDVVFAVVAGAAAALSVISVVSMALVGVAIAASIVPPAANVGIGIAYLIRGYEGAQEIVIGSAILLIINILIINAMSVIFFWLKGIHPAVSERKKKLAKKAVRKQLLVITLALIIVLIPVAQSSINSYYTYKMEQKARNLILNYIETHYPDIDVCKLDVSYIKAKNMFYIYLTIAISRMEDIPGDLPNEIKATIKDSLGADSIIYIMAMLKST